MKGTKFVRCADFPFRTRVFSEAMREWTEDLSYEDRRELTDVFFDALSATGAETLTDLTAQKLRKAVTVARGLLGNSGSRTLLLDSFELLLREYLQSARRELPRGRLHITRRRREN